MMCAVLTLLEEGNISMVPTTRCPVGRLCTTLSNRSSIPLIAAVSLYKHERKRLRSQKRQ